MEFGSFEGARFKDGVPSRGYIQKFVHRGEAQEQITMDSTIHDSDRWAEWRHHLNVEGYFDSLQAELVRQKNFITFPTFDKEVQLSEPGRVKELDRVHMMDESKLKVEQLKQSGKGAQKIVPFKKGAKHRRKMKKLGEHSALALGLTFSDFSDFAAIVAGIRADKQVTRSTEKSVSNTIIHLCKGNGKPGIPCVVYMAGKVKESWKTGGPKVKVDGKWYDCVYFANEKGGMTADLFL